MNDFLLAEFRTHSVARASRFYGKLFAWQIRRGAPGIPAALIDAGPGPRGFLLQVPDSVPLTVCPYLSCDDCQAAATKAAELGAQVLIENEEAGFLGAFSLVIDPWGNHLAYVESDGEPLGPTANDGTNRFAWLDLRAPQLDRGIDYYSKLLGFSFEKVGERYAKGGPAGEPPRIGLRGDKRELGALVYVEVANLAEAVTAIVDCDGQVIENNQPLADLGQYALVGDEEGNHFALLEPSA